MIITLTGHRNLDCQDLAEKLNPLILFIKMAAADEEGMDVEAYWGGAPGGDITFAEVCRMMDIPLTAFLPDPFYEKRTIKPQWKTQFDACIAASEAVIYAGQTNDWRNNFKRNEMMINPADLVFAAYAYDDIDMFTKWYRPRKGGTSHGIQCALRADHVLGDSLIRIPVKLVT